MYRIKFPSGEVSTIESSEALTEAVRSGTVTSYCFILHERSGQWLPIVRHPHYHRALTARSASASAAAPEIPAILTEPLDVPAAAAPAPATPARSTADQLAVRKLDELLEMVEMPEAAEPAPGAPVAKEPPAPPAATAPAPRPRGRSRELEFLYVPEAKAGGKPAQSAPRTAGPPPRPAAPAPATKPVTEARQAPSAPARPQPEARAAGEKPTAPSVVAPTAPTVLQPAPAQVVRAAPEATRPDASAPAPVRAESTPAAPLRTEAGRPETVRPEPVRSEPVRPEPVRPEPVRPEPVQVVSPPKPAAVRQPDPEPVREVEESVARAPVATLAPPSRRAAERYDHDLVDPVEAALNFDGPAPIELSLPERTRMPGASRRILIAAGLVVTLGGGLLAWSPWSGGAREVAAATTRAPEDAADQRDDAAPAAEPGFDPAVPAEEEPAIDIYAVSPSPELSARTSFGGTAAASGAAVTQLPQAGAPVLPGPPKTLRVAVPVVGSAENLDSIRLANVKRAITQ